MNQALRFAVAGLLFPAIVLSCVACKSSGEPKSSRTKDRQENAPGAVNVMTVTKTATVESVDQANRKVTLKMPDGETREFTVGKNVQNFDQIKVGDQLKSTLIDSLAVSVRKSDAPPLAEERGAVALTAKGGLPGLIMADTDTITDKISAIDTKERTITLQGAGGSPQTIKVGPNVSLSDLKVGDEVVVRFTKATIVRFEKP